MLLLMILVVADVDVGGVAPHDVVVATDVDAANVARLSPNLHAWFCMIPFLWSSEV